MSSQGIVPTTIIIVAALGLTYRKDGSIAHQTTTTHESTVQFSHSNTRASRPWASTATGADVDDIELPIPLSKLEVDGDVEARSSAITWQNLSSTSAS